MKTEYAPAKVNLTLRVGPVRADGYHPISSVVVFADWGDEVTAEPLEAGEGLHLRLDGAGARELDETQNNLVLKVAWALRAAAERPDLAARLTLKKDLPVAAGLGGGSSDAAAALRALDAVWDLGFSTKALAEIGSAAGSDVPACVHARPLVMEGRGEIIKPLAAWPALHAVLLHPGVPVSTGAVFRDYDAHDPARLEPEPLAAAGDVDTVVARLEASRNDLEAPALRLEPMIGDALAALRDTDGVKLARMSGSGATCFALYAGKSEADAAARRLNASRPGWRARSVLFGGAAV